MYKNKPNEGEERQEKTRELEKKLVKELWPLLVGVKRESGSSFGQYISRSGDGDPAASASQSWVVVE